MCSVDFMHSDVKNKHELFDENFYFIEKIVLIKKRISLTQKDVSLISLFDTKYFLEYSLFGRKLSVIWKILK